MVDRSDVGDVCRHCRPHAAMAGTAGTCRCDSPSQCLQRRMAVYTHPCNNFGSAGRSTGGWLSARAEVVRRVCHNLDGSPAAQCHTEYLVFGRIEAGSRRTPAGKFDRVIHSHACPVQRLCVLARTVPVWILAGKATAAIQRATDGDRISGDADARSQSIHSGAPCQ